MLTKMGRPIIKLMSFTRSFLCVICCLLSLAGCSFSTPYPNTWPTTASAMASQCHGLTGAYENWGSSSDDYQLSLAKIFFSVKLSDPPALSWERNAVTHLTFTSGLDSGVTVKAWVGSELLEVRQLSASQMPCREGRLVYHDTSWELTGVAPYIPVVAHNSIDYLIAVAQDESLVIERKMLSVGTVLFVPVGVNEKTWFRYPQSSPDSPNRLNDDTNPRGVRAGATTVHRLLPPEGVDGHGYNIAQACVAQAVAADQPPGQPALDLLEGHATQAFLVQRAPQAAIAAHGHVIGKSWIPTSHDYRVEKLHWKSPSVADHYVICLIREGYRWEDTQE